MTDNTSGDDKAGHILAMDPNGGPRNPWGAGGNNSGGGPRGSQQGGSNNNQPPPDLDDMLRKAQDNLRQIFPEGGNSGKFVGIALLVVLLLWVASGVYFLSPGQHGVELRFGKLSQTVTREGPHWHMPWPIESVDVVVVNEIRNMNIGFFERFSRNGTQVADNLEESLMLTSDTNIVDLHMVVQWNISDAADYLFNIKDQENTIKKVAESAIREIVGQTRMFPIITQGRDQVAQRAKEIMTANLDQYHSGVNITQVLIQKAEVHPDVQAAFQDVQSAKQDAEDLQNKAQAYREDILPKARGSAIQMVQEAQGYKQSTVAQATGDANRFEAIFEAYKTGRDVTKERLYLETMEDVLGNAQKIIVDDKSGNGVVPYLPLNELKKNSGAN